MKYIFYESFQYKNNTARVYTVTTLTNRVTVYTNPQRSLVVRMQRIHGEKYASVNKTTNKLYVRERVRRATVRYCNQERFHNPELDYSFVDNRLLHINITKGDFPEENY